MSRTVAPGPRLSVVAFCILGFLVTLSGPALCELAPVCTMACCVATPAPMCGTHPLEAIVANDRPSARMFPADLETELEFDLESAHPAMTRVAFRVVAPVPRSTTALAGFVEHRSSLRRLHVLLDVFRI